jgi:serine/threonine protein kinase/tetratricopeptide (TPR) repeat protein
MLRLSLDQDKDPIASSLEDHANTELAPPHPSTVTRFENYEVSKSGDGKPIELGRGGMGVTYKATDVDLRCQVALKVINERYLNDQSVRLRFIREARAAASVRHPNVATVHHLGKSGENYFYAMEFVEGETLQKLIERTGRLEVKLALEITTQIASGLVAVHKQHLVHRDIKPPNIMVNLQDEGAPMVKIIDLGLAKGLDEPSADSAISFPGAFIGTAEFASPEQLTGLGADIRSDLYSVGVTLWKMLTGRTPFQGSPTDVMAQHQHTPLPLENVKVLPQPVVVLLQMLLEKDPSRRFQSPAELLKVMPSLLNAIDAGRCTTRQDLKTIAAGVASSSNKKEMGIRPVRLTRTINWRIRRLLWPIIGFLITGGVVLFVVILFGLARQAAYAPKDSSHDVIPPNKSIAVLPFESLSENKSDAYFADGIQDEILSKLAKVSQLRVISRTSVMAYRPSGHRDLRSIASALGVANVVEGTVRRSGNRVRITTELVDARTDETLWSESYDRDLTDIFTIQSEIAESVASRLSARLTPEEGRDIEQKPTKDLDAFDLYLQAKELLVNSSLDRSEKSRLDCLGAIQRLEEATRKDTRFALAFCLMARAHDQLYADEFDNTQERRTLGDAAVQKALDLRPDIPEVNLAAALHLYVCYRDYEGARTKIALAAQELPNNPDLFMLTAYLDRRQGRWVEATAELEKAATLDPRNPETLRQLELTYRYQRRYQECERVLNRLVELEVGNPVFEAMKASLKLDAEGNSTIYRDALTTLLSQRNDDMDILSRLFNAAVFARDWASAQEILNRNSNREFFFFDRWGKVPSRCLEIWLALVRGDRPTMDAGFAATREELNLKVAAHPEDHVLLSALSLVDAALGRKQEAIREARQAVEALPVSKDAIAGPLLLVNLAAVYARTDEPDLALQTLAISANTPGGVTYGELKLDPAWDPIRRENRFDQLLTQLAPHK